MSEDNNEAKSGGSTIDKGISRSAFNYALIAAVFMLIGIMIGNYLWNSDADKRVLVDEAQLRSLMISVLEESDIARASDMALAAEEELPDRFALVDDDPYLGDVDAPVVIVEFSDFFCSYCKRHFDQTFAPLLENYGQHIRYVYRDFARLTQESTPAAAAAQCAFAQDKFWEFREDFFNNQGSLNRDYYIQTAEAHELNVAKYTACIDEGRFVGEVELDGFDGQIAGVRGTPGFFINGQILSGAQPYVIFERMIRLELQKAGIDFSQDG